MKKTIYKIWLFYFFVGFITSCDYLDVVLDNQMTQEEAFSKRETTERYLAHIYDYLPNTYDLLSDAGSAVPRSDEALFSWYSGVSHLVFNDGTWGVTTGAFNIWKGKYEAINQATVFMDNVDQCLDLTEEVRTRMKAEVRFLRAYFYFELVCQYGPVFVWGDKTPDIMLHAEDVDRHPLDVNLEFIENEFDKAMADLPMTITDPMWQGRITKPIVMAAKSRLLLYAASPLFNGCSLYYGLKNKDGEFLFPQSPDPSKWDRAAKVAKDVIDLNMFSLYEDKTESDPFRKAIKSYQGVVFEEWNNEVIWGCWQTDGFQLNVRSLPPRVVKEGYGGFAPSIKLVDTYPMAESGRYPILGYNANGSPIIDEKSGYSDSGFTENFEHPLENKASGYTTIKAHNSCVGRDARFYASILANGFNFYNTYKGIKLVTFFNGGTSSYLGSGDCVKVGYLWRRMTDPQLDVENGNWGRIFWPYYRLAEIYLNYAEACNEKKNRNESEALKYVNLIRARAGLNKLEEAYPEVIGNQELLRTLIQKERMVELAFEAHRYYDVRRWMIAEKEMSGANWCRNVMSTTYEGSWERTDQVWTTPRVFQPKHYFFPINQAQLNEIKNMTQNYGW